GNGALNAGMFLIGYYSGGAISGGSIANIASNAGLQGCANTIGLGYAANMSVSSAISSLLPSINVPIGENSSISLSPAIMLGNGGFNVGANISANISLGDNFTLGVSAGLNYGKSGFTMDNGWEGRASGFFGYDDGEFGIGVSTNQFWSGETTQRTGRLSLRANDFSLSYENDGFPFDKVGLGGGTDSYRTASVTLGYKDVTMGMLLFTGYRDMDAIDRTDKINYPHGMVGNPEINDYNAGILYVGYKNWRAGWNHDDIRHGFQNVFAHGMLKPQAWIPRKNWPNGPYMTYGTYNPYTNW
ncbi:hypothetical protein JZU68_09970, partial [bacterium]|nr:hypothetical protein [bacterium]